MPKLGWRVREGSQVQPPTASQAPVIWTRGVGALATRSGGGARGVEGESALRIVSTIDAARRAEGVIQHGRALRVRAHGGEPVDHAALALHPLELVVDRHRGLGLPRRGSRARIITVRTLRRMSRLVSTSK
jgi:hypothetical protein